MPRRKSSPRKASDTNSVVVRMYRGLLGDCFLLRFPRSDTGDAYVLIDCGAFRGMPKEKETMRKIAADIMQTVGNVIDVVVVTHEHWDHLSGFAHAEDLFAPLKIKELWLAWTEDDFDEQAKRLQERRQRTRELLITACSLRAGARLSDGEDAVDVELAFLGVDRNPDASVEEVPSTGTILKYLKEKADNVRCLSPGIDPPDVAGVPSVKAYVLGPPRDELLLRQSDPTKKGKETYELGLAAEAQEDHFIAVRRKGGAIASDDENQFYLRLPFDRRRIAWTRKFKFNPKVQPEEASDGTAEPSARLKAVYERYSDETEEWRRIDNDWLGAAEQLALKLDSDTNNTSLVLAFEIGKARKVLLFPGDAQVGNWLSWHDCRWPKDAKDDDPNLVTAKRLLERTVLYKVGHHASHNATLREQGLEWMTSPELVAMIPVNEEFARDKKHWDMPFQPLLERLKERTRGRVLRADRAASDTIKECKSPDLDAFDKRATDGPDGLYLEYRIPIE